MFKSSRKKLIAIGCSFTTGASVKRQNSWPTNLAQKLDMDCVNLGKGGQGNEYISAKLIDVILAEKKEDIGLVVLMWSGWERIDFLDTRGVWNIPPPLPSCATGGSALGETLAEKIQELGKKFSTAREAVEYLDSEGVIAYGEFWDNMSNAERRQLADSRYNNSYNLIMKSLRHFLITQRLLKDISYLMIQGVGTNVSYLHHSHDDGWIDILLNSKIFYEIDEDKFIGWPIIQEIGGYNVENILDKLDPERTQLRISVNDTHPNVEGHKIIAQEIYNAYEKIYT